MTETMLRLPLDDEPASASASTLSINSGSIGRSWYARMERCALSRRDIEVAVTGCSQDCKPREPTQSPGPSQPSARVATAGDVRNFHNARQFAAWIGLVLRQNSAGGKTLLPGHQHARRRIPAHAPDPRWTRRCPAPANSIARQRRLARPLMQML